MRRRLVNLVFNLAAAVSLVLCVLVAVLWPLNRTYFQYVTYGRPLDDSGRRWIINVTADVSGVMTRLDLAQRIDASFVPLVGWVFHAGRYPPGGRPSLSRHRGQTFSFLGFTYERNPRVIGFNSMPVATVDRRSLGTPVVTIDRRSLTIPYWFLIATGMILPVWRIHVWRRQRRRREERRCPTCGYDMRATPGRCPECGTAAAAP